MEHRIRAYDRLNWVIEREKGASRKGAREATARDPYPDWAVLGYYPSVKHAALALLDIEARAGEPYGAQGVIRAVERAERAVLRAVAEMRADSRERVRVASGAAAVN